jgi:hypothetical protein
LYYKFKDAEAEVVINYRKITINDKEVTNGDLFYLLQSLDKTSLIYDYWSIKSNKVFFDEKFELSIRDINNIRDIFKLLNSKVKSSVPTIKLEVLRILEGR